MMRIFAPLLIAAILSQASAARPDEAEIESVLANRVDEAKKTVGIVVGVIDRSGQYVVSRGKLALTGTTPVDANTVFEIGSITKVFTSLLLADMIERGEVKLDDPVAKYLPAGVTVPSRNGRQITLKDLSMHTSGLARLPGNIKPADAANPYADYTAAQLYEYLSLPVLVSDPGEKYNYSNLGGGLLGHALARKAGMSYEDAVRRRILEPLGMKDTSITLTKSQRDRLATGHDAALHPVKNWDLNVLEAAGGLRSTANDMLRFLAANLEFVDSPLRPALRRMRSVHREIGAPDLSIMLAWHVLSKYGTTIVWHNGGTGGYRSFLGFDLASGKGVIVLSSSAVPQDDLGLHILEPKYEVK